MLNINITFEIIYYFTVYHIISCKLLLSRVLSLRMLLDLAILQIYHGKTVSKTNTVLLLKSANISSMQI